MALFITICFALALLPAFIYSVEMAFGCLPLRRRNLNPWHEPRPRVAVLIPAHNEEFGIRNTLDSVQAQLHPADRVLVIADNCTDATAEMARGSAGAIALVRTDKIHQGKGFALAYGINQLRVYPPEVVVFIDADCRLGPGTIDALARAAVLDGRPVQALNLCVPPPRSGTRHLISGLAFRFKNLIRMWGMGQIGDVCHLTGTGMAIPWKLIDTVKWASGNVVEDMQLGIDYTLAGYPPRFVPEGQILSDLPPSVEGLMQQRRRWEHGFLATALVQVPKMLLKAWTHRSWPLAVLAFDLHVPPLALLSVHLSCIWLAAVLAWFAGYHTPLWMTSVVNTSYFFLTIAGWYVHCREVMPLQAFLQVPSYVLSKLPLYLDFIIRRQNSWIRAQRTNG